MTKPNRGGLRFPKGGRPPKSSKGEERYRHRNITLPPVTDDRLIKWSLDTGADISALINRLVLDFFDKEHK